MRLPVVVVLLCAGLSVSAWALPPNVRAVNAAAAPGGDGRDWATAYNDLQPALDEASTPGSGVNEIWLAAGTYRPSHRTNPTEPRSATFAIGRGVSVYGGFVGGETSREQRNSDPATNGTVLSGSLGMASAFHVVNVTGADTSTVLDGFTVRDGNAAATNSSNPDSHGGGITADSGEATFQNLIVTQNLAEWHGGGMYIAGSPVMTNVVVSSNQVTGWNGSVGGLDIRGGARVSDCQILSNHAPGTSASVGGFSIDGPCEMVRCTIVGNGCHEEFGGGGCSDSTLSDCVIRQNGGTEGAGGLGLSGCTVIRCDISNNASAIADAALRAQNTTFVNCTIEGNRGEVAVSLLGSPLFISCDIGSNIGNTTAVSEGGTFVNCLIHDNMSYVGSGSIRGTLHNSTLVGCTVVNSWTDDHSVPIWGGTLTDCIVWANGRTTSQIANATVNYSTVQDWDGSLGGVGNNALDPMFVDPMTDFHLRPGSPCIDSGDNSAVPPGVFTDAEGRVRFFDSPEPDGGNGFAPVVDRGCYEAGPAVSFCYGNLDGSIIPPVLNVGDFMNFMSLFAAGHPLANCDGSTTPPLLNSADFMCFMHRFAEGCGR